MASLNDCLSNSKSANAQIGFWVDQLSEQTIVQLILQFCSIINLLKMWYTFYMHIFQYLSTLFFVVCSLWSPVLVIFCLSQKNSSFFIFRQPQSPIQKDNHPIKLASLCNDTETYTLCQAQTCCDNILQSLYFWQRKRNELRRSVEVHF